ncbi:MAG: hypothetical protein FWC80_02435 [Firmicutes bacterium]|nr:hypothetical protein [Bacillota bacterium]
MTNTQIAIENLTNIFNAVFEIKNDLNKNIYDECGDENNVRYVLQSLSQHKKLKKGNMDRFQAVDSLDEKIALMSQELNYIYRAYPPMFESFNRLIILFNIAEKLKIDLGII